MKLTYAKALVAGAVAGLSALLPVMEDGLSNAEIVVAVIALLSGLGITYATPNAASADPTTSTPGPYVDPQA